MPLLHLFLVAVVQGITEFLPVSSSGHLILLPAIMGLPDQGLAIDVAVHVGTLGAVMLYFRRDVALLASGTLWGSSPAGSPPGNPTSRCAWSWPRSP